MGRPVVHWEFWSEDPARISEFYKKIFDWGIKDMPEMDYRLVETGGEGGINGGIFKPKEGPWPSKLTFYIHVDELAPYVKKVKDAGGRIHIERQEVPGMGEFALFQDPEGRMLGLWSPKK